MGRRPGTAGIGLSGYPLSPRRVDRREEEGPPQGDSGRATLYGKLRNTAQAYPAVDVWHIALPDVRKRIATAATVLIIEVTTVQELITAYAAFSATADFVIGHVPRRSRDFRILTSENQDTYFDTPAYRRLVKLVVRLSSDERIDLLALAWFGRESTKSSAWTYFLNHAHRMASTIPITKRDWTATGRQGSTVSAMNFETRPDQALSDSAPLVRALVAARLRRKADRAAEELATGASREAKATLSESIRISNITSFMHH